MRKSVVTFWWMPEDEKAFLDYLGARHEIVAFTAPWKKRPEEVVPRDFGLLVAQADEAKLMFGCADHMRGKIVESHEFPGSGLRYNVTCESSCLLWFSRDLRHPVGKLSLRSIGVYWDRHDTSTRTVTPKPDDFQKWGRAVMRWIRERTPEKEGLYRTSALVKKAIADGSVEVIAH